MKMFCGLLVILVVSCGTAYANLSQVKHSRHFYGLPAGDAENLPRDEWFLQKLDHSDPTNPGTWWQRYQTNGTWFKNARNSPVFLMIGGEGPASAKWVVQGAWMGYAEKYNALCFQLEHRFYGKSMPKADLSVESLQYLSSEQALADIAYFIEEMTGKYKLGRNNRWVVFGGSYSGSLAAWARLKYPHLIHAAVSTSGPLLAQLNFKQYNEVVRESLSASSRQCSESVHKAALGVEDALKTDQGARDLSKKFGLCTPLDLKNTKDVENFAQTLAGNIQGVVQYNKDNRITSGNAPPSPTVDDICAIMTNESLGQNVDRYAAVNAALNLVTEKCIDVSYHNYISQMRDITYGSNAASRAWIYQTCTEFGFYQTSGSRSDLFGSLFKLQFFIDQCKDIYGDDFDLNRLNEGIKRSNVIYGQLSLQVSNVVFVQGTGDPWHVLGINKALSSLAPSIVIPGTAHCANMYPPSPKDPPQLTQAREEIQQFIGDWLQRR